ncbi:unnamed protein product [Adineta ricciae]|uniref:Uncharacterized protein n=1 Tax=Adineta ricciae TaxID=249248 RepID=A0A814TP46_ADIRI|nr:unnamed protein product [Adineta ricciae]CAF1644180.1 unnamed protein product [Adineta ricciae]
MLHNRLRPVRRLSNTSSPANSLPTMFFIHNGGFPYGYATEPIYEAEHKYEVSLRNLYQSMLKPDVSVFLATENGLNDIKDNYRILAQRLVTAWVKGNINALGSDPN